MLVYVISIYTEYTQIYIFEDKCWVAMYEKNHVYWDFMMPDLFWKVVCLVWFKAFSQYMFICYTAIA